MMSTPDRSDYQGNPEERGTAAYGYDYRHEDERYLENEAMEECKYIEDVE